MSIIVDQILVEIEVQIHRIDPSALPFTCGFTRVQLYRFMRENDLENDVIAFATDSIATRKD